MHGTHVKRDKPVLLLKQENEPQGPSIVELVKDEGTTEGWSVIDQIEVAISPHAKAGRLPSGLSARKRLSNRLRRECR
jgi:hypothetical protein